MQRRVVYHKYGRIFGVSSSPIVCGPWFEEEEMNLAENLERSAYYFPDRLAILQEDRKTLLTALRT